MSKAVVRQFLTAISAIIAMQKRAKAVALQSTTVTFETNAMQKDKTAEYALHYIGFV
ncbi:hypothetical protein [Bartonella sp. LJL80]